MSIVFQPSHPDTGTPLYEERVIAVRVEPNLHSESYLRDVTDEMRSPWNFVVVSKSSQTVINVAQNSRIQCSLFAWDSRDNNNIVEFPNVQEQMI